MSGYGARHPADILIFLMALCYIAYTIGEQVGLASAPQLDCGPGAFKRVVIYNKGVDCYYRDSAVRMERRAK